MSTAPWSSVVFNSEGPNAIGTITDGIGAPVGMVGRVVVGTQQSATCPVGQCCPLEGWAGCFAMERSLFVDYTTPNLNNGNTNLCANGCTAPANGTCTQTPLGSPGTDPILTCTNNCPNGDCAFGEYYSALPNINYQTGWPGAQWLVIAGMVLPGVIDGCIEIIDIVHDEATWNSGQVNCPSTFTEGNGTVHPGGGLINYTDLKLLATGGDPVSNLETNCNSCVTNVLGCMDPLAINYQYNCSGTYVGTPTIDDTCCIYPGCPDSSALNYVNNPLYNNGCGTISNGSWVTGGPTDTSCCEYPGCIDSTTPECNISTPIVTPLGNIPGPMGCVANYQDDCNGNYTGPPATGGILIQTTDTCWTLGCFYVGCPDSDATNYNAAAHGCVFPPTSGIDDVSCCEYLGCDDPTAPNYGESCNGLFNVITDKNTLPTGPCIPDNCQDPIIPGCMDDGCCVDGVINLVDPTTTLSCPNGTHLCPTTGGGPSVNSSFPPGCTPGIDCVDCNHDPNANEHDPNMCACEGGYYCNIANNPGCIAGIDCCIDIYLSSVMPPYVWSGPPMFGPCNDAASCAAALADCNLTCATPDLDDCVVFMNDKEGNVYFYGPPNPPTHTTSSDLSFLFRDEQFDENLFGQNYKYGTGSWDIANTQDRLWLYSCRVVNPTTGNDILVHTSGMEYESNDPAVASLSPSSFKNKGIIREYVITLPTFTVGDGAVMAPPPVQNPNYKRDIDITDICANGYDTNRVNDVGEILYHVGNALVARDNDTLIAGGYKIQDIDITGPTGVATELFTLPNLTFPSFGTGVGVTTQQGEATGDIILDKNSGDLIITYFDSWPVNNKVAKFVLAAGVGAQMGDSTNNPTQWWETQVQAYPAPAPQPFGLFTWEYAGVLSWYAAGATINGADVFDMDVSTLVIDTTAPIGSVTTQAATPPNLSNPIYGASQKDGCTPIDEEGCLDATALNFNDCCNPFPGCLPTLHKDVCCVYPPEGRGGCLPRLTKQEFLMNVVQKPEVQSDVFIERGKVSVFERPQRLAQTSTIGELELHGYGYYNILIQE
jgi:hypothetical protein